MDTDPKSNACVPGVWNAQRLREVHSACHIDSVLGEGASVVTHRDTQECSENLTNQAVSSTWWIQNKWFNCHVPFQHLQHKSLKALLDSPTQAPHRSSKRIWRAPLLSSMLQLAQTCSKRLMRYLKNKTPTGLQKAAFQQLPSTSLTLPQIPILGGFNDAMPSNTAVLRAADPIARTSSCCFKRMLRHLHQLLNRHDAWEHLTIMAY